MPRDNAVSTVSTTSAILSNFVLLPLAVATVRAPRPDNMKERSESEGGRASVTFLMTTAPIGAAPRQKQGNENRSKSSAIVR